MKYLVVKSDGRFATDAKARGFSSEYPNAHLFESANEAYAVAKKLRIKDSGAHAVSEKAYAQDQAIEREPS
jgi:hypothetical protein